MQNNLYHSRQNYNPSAHRILKNQNNIIVNNPQQVKSTKFLRRTTQPIRNSPKSKAVSSICSQQAESLSKFYVKNVFSDNQQEDQAHAYHQSSRKDNKIANFQNDKKIKNQGLELPEIKVIGLQYSKSVNNLRNSFLTKRTVIEMTNDSINTNDKQIQIKQLKRQLLQSQISREDLMIQNRRLKYTLGISFREKQKAGHNTKLQDLNKQNEQIKKELNLIKLGLTEKNPRTQLTRALLYIQKLQQQIISIKEELMHTYESLSMIKKKYEIDQHNKRAKKHKMEQIKQKYKDLILRVHELNNEASTIQEEGLEKYFLINENKKKVFKVK